MVEDSHEIVVILHVIERLTNVDKAIETIKTVMDRRGKKFNKKDKLVLQHIFDFTAKYRGRI